MEVVRTFAELAELRRTWHNGGERVGFVPTMGYLHAGHLNLIDVLPTPVTRKVVSIYVNPTQFAADEDLDRYPVDIERDLAGCEAHGADAVWLPQAKEMYPDGPQNQVLFVEPGRLGDRLCGLDRPTHFRGVLTVVAKLFHLVRPHYAVFGEKDFQQLRLIETLVRELNFPVEIVRSPTLREDDGLALSSRNRYLTDQERAVAPLLQRQLQKAAHAIVDGADLKPILKAGREAINAVWGKKATEYFECRRESDLEPANEKELRTTPCRLFAAGRLDKARLIDNLALTF